MRAADIVVSKAGRDRGLPFVVLSVKDNYVFLADGRHRKADKPKMKKIKHVSEPEGHSSMLERKLEKKETLFDRELRKEIHDNSAQQALGY